MLAYPLSSHLSHPINGKRTVLSLVGLGVTPRRLHIATAVGKLHHPRLVGREVAGHVDLHRGAQGEGGGEGEDNDRDAHGGW